MNFKIRLILSISTLGTLGTLVTLDTPGIPNFLFSGILITFMFRKLK